MKGAAREFSFRLLATIAVTASSAAGASTCLENSTACSAAVGPSWMPDVAERRADLHARFEHFSAERVRRMERGESEGSGTVRARNSR